MAKEAKGAKEKAEELNNSALFDVHRWSDYPEVKRAVDALYDEMKAKHESGKAEVRKKSIKILVLDLYVKWLTDPTLYMSIYRRKEYYTKVDGRYNKLHIKFDGIKKAMDFLIAEEYAIYYKGHYARGKKHSSHISRLRATEKLINLIVAVHGIQPHMVEKAPNTECIILRDLNEDETKQVDIAYDDTSETERMRQELFDYNNLLRAIFIHIPEYPSDGIPTTGGKKKIKISQHEKFVRRIFNNGTFNEGGRYYGGWWQRIPKEWRAKIHIWERPTTEIDYSGLHITLLYALEGIAYWTTIGTDPYAIPGVEETERMRNLLKLILLTVINAKDKKKAIKGITWTINTDLDEYGWVKDEKITLGDVIDKFTDHHKVIRKHFFSSSGTKLQNTDSIIASKIINHFTSKKLPVLCIHDSFLIAAQHAEELERVMSDAFESICQEFDISDPKSVKKATGMEVGKWNVLISHPDYRDEMIERLHKPKYEYSEWTKRMDEFRKIDRDYDFYKSDF